MAHKRKRRRDPHDEVDTDFSMTTDENSDSPSDRTDREREDVVFDEEGFTAFPHQQSARDFADSEVDALESGLDFGPASESDARQSGYTSPAGRAVEKAKPPGPGSPTGALTDLGEGRSSVVKQKKR